MAHRPNPLIGLPVPHPPGTLIVEQLCRRCRRPAVRFSATHLCPTCRERVARAA